MGLSVGITFLKDGLFYSLLPIIGSMLFGQTGLWAAFAVAPLLALALSLLFEIDSVLLIERDSGMIFDVTDPELKIDGLSSFVINGFLNAQKEKSYLTTTGYNRNMIRFAY